MSEHVEGTCEVCGGANPNWHVDSDRWNTAFRRGVIACPTCFVVAHEAATGMRANWKIEPATPFAWIGPDGRETPFLAPTREDQS